MGRICFDCVVGLSVPTADHSPDVAGCSNGTLENPPPPPLSTTTDERTGDTIDSNCDPGTATVHTEIWDFSGTSNCTLQNPPHPPLSTSSEESPGGWDMRPCPSAFKVHLDVIDRSQIHDYRLETNVISERAMQQLYPGWKHGSRKKYAGTDRQTRVRK
jgi:hypothetical protein